MKKKIVRFYVILFLYSLRKYEYLELKCMFSYAGYRPYSIAIHTIQIYCSYYPATV